MEKTSKTAAPTAEQIQRVLDIYSQLLVTARDVESLTAESILENWDSDSFNQNRLPHKRTFKACSHLRKLMGYDIG